MLEMNTEEKVAPNQDQFESAPEKAATGPLPEATVSYMTAKIPMARCGTLDEAARLAAFAVSPACGFTTGFTFDLSGGRATY